MPRLKEDWRKQLEAARQARQPRGRPKKPKEAWEQQEKRKPGRPKGATTPEQAKAYELKHDSRNVSELSELQLGDHEIALYINKPLEYVQQNFRYDIDLHQLKGKIRLLAAQWRKAMEGNSNMLIWLGKHYLGQRDENHLTTIEPEIRMLFTQIERLENDRAKLLERPVYKSEFDIIPMHKTESAESAESGDQESDSSGRDLCVLP